MKAKKTQNSWLLQQLKKKRKITSLVALMEADCMRLSARVYDLRCLGYNIQTENVHLDNGKVVARYFLK
jgi:hypothetical protein